MLIVLVLRIYKTEKQQFFFIKYNLKSISSVSFSIMKNWFGEGGGGVFVSPVLWISIFHQQIQLMKLN